MAGKPKRSTFRTRLEDMVTTLRSDIVTGKLQPGDFLPSELTLAEQFQLSKNSVRKGLEALLDQEMIEKAPRIGTRVVGTGRNEKLTLKFGYYPTLALEANLLELVEKFQQQHPHIIVQMIPLSNSYFSQNVKEAMERDGLDLITLNTQNYETVTETGAVSDILSRLNEKIARIAFCRDRSPKTIICTCSRLFFHRSSCVTTAIISRKQHCQSRIAAGVGTMYRQQHWP